MVEQEAPQEDLPGYLSPEYWNGHSPDDSCLAVAPREVAESIPEEELRRIRKSASRALEEFLGLPDQNPIRSYSSGQLFDSNDQNDGMIIRLNTELLELASGFYRLSERRSFWGVVFGYKAPDKSRKKVLLFYPAIPEFDPVKFPQKYVVIADPRAVVGKVNHFKIGDADGKTTEIYKRVNSLAIYTNGKEVREKNEGRIRLPNFGDIFRTPFPQSA